MYEVEAALPHSSRKSEYKGCQPGSDAPEKLVLRSRIGLPGAILGCLSTLGNPGRRHKRGESWDQEQVLDALAQVVPIPRESPSIIQKCQMTTAAEISSYSNAEKTSADLCVGSQFPAKEELVVQTPRFALVESRLQ